MVVVLRKSRRETERVVAECLFMVLLGKCADWKPGASEKINRRREKLFSTSLKPRFNVATNESHNHQFCRLIFLIYEHLFI